MAIPNENIARAHSASDTTASHHTSNSHISSLTTSAPAAPISEAPTVIGALNANSVGTGIPNLGVDPAATTYPSDGNLHSPQPAPFVPAGGVGTNGTTPVYNVKSDFDFESLALALYTEYIELDVFNHGLSRFSEADFLKAGLNAEDRYLIQFMAEQEIGHAALLRNLLGPKAPRPCNYTFPFRTIQEFVDLCQKVTRVGESGVNGFLAHLDSREAAALLSQTVTTEGRQQMIFRQFEGLFPMPVWFEPAIPHAWAWSLLAPLIKSCPSNQTRLAWQNFPALWILEQPNPTRVNASAGHNETLGAGLSVLSNANITKSASCLNNTTVGVHCNPAITHNRTTPLSYAENNITLLWEAPGKLVGPNGSYITSTSAGSPKYVAWVTQLNVTYSTLDVYHPGIGTTVQPNMSVFPGGPGINNTMFIAVTDSDPVLSPFNISAINPHVVAGPALFQAG
ncbi:hypothetical protein AWENTII_007914 [Aspergillus wentii]